MPSKTNNEKSTPDDLEAYCEELASQEEICLEEEEEEVHMILESYPASSPKGAETSMCDATDEPRGSENMDEQRDHAVEELVTGDADDPPLSEEKVVEMIRTSHMSRQSKKAS